MPVIEMRGVRFGYGPVPVFDGADLEVRAGTLDVLTGPNGSGKSTLLKLALGLLSPSAGEIRVLDRPAGDPSALRRIGYAPQGVGGRMVLPISVRELVGAGITPSKPLLSRLGRPDRARIDAALGAVGLGDLARECVFELSGGQQQRAVLARALVGDPEVLLFDEPTTGIDRAFRNQLVKELRRRADGGAAVVVVSHDPEDFHEVVDRILALEDGKVRDVSHDEYHEARG